MANTNLKKSDKRLGVYPPVALSKKIKTLFETYRTFDVTTTLDRDYATLKRVERGERISAIVLADLTKKLTKNLFKEKLTA